jgi:phosphoribosylformimino-5-aminoimidazole carboxamide ribotide isomerase
VTNRKSESNDVSETGDLSASEAPKTSSFIVIPVVDVMNGIVVRGVAGRRSSYKPVESCLCDSHDPAEVLQAFREWFGLRVYYIADLDALEGIGVQWALLESLCQPGIDLWVDAGFTSANSVRRMADLLFTASDGSRLIIASETLRSMRDFSEVVSAIGPERVVFSLDLMQGKVRGQGDGVAGVEPMELMRRIAAAGVTRTIVLDVAGVGMRRGVLTLELCRTLRVEHPEVALFSGGGVQSQKDLWHLKDAGCAGALVATALHDGVLTPDDVR